MTDDQPTVTELIAGWEEEAEARVAAIRRERLALAGVECQLGTIAERLQLPEINGMLEAIKDEIAALNRGLRIGAILLSAVLVVLFGHLHW